MQNKSRKTSDKIQAKRTQLIELSAKAKSIRAKLIHSAKSPAEIEFWSTRTLNYILLRFVYNNGADVRYNTFAEWKAQGATIRKGAKATVIWGQPRKGLALPEQPDGASSGDGNSEDGKEYEFFPLCFLFSENDVFFPSAESTPQDTPECAAPERSPALSVDDDILNNL